MPPFSLSSYVFLIIVSIIIFLFFLNKRRKEEDKKETLKALSKSDRRKM